VLDIGILNILNQQTFNLALSFIAVQFPYAPVELLMKERKAVDFY
jgi:hypothetical protein